MPLTSGILLPLSAAVVFAGYAAAQDAPKLQLTARQLYYYASAEKSPEAAKAETAKPAAKAPARKPGNRAGTGGAARKAVDAAPAAPAPSPDAADRVPVVQNAVAERPVTAPAPVSGQPLGLRYTVLKLTGGQGVDVPPDTVFHSGDRIRFNVQANAPGYLYIVSQGSSGTWKMMFPSPEMGTGHNRLEPFKSYTMPPNYRYSFDEQSGTEKVFIVLSREPESDLEKLIYSLQSKAQPANTPQTQQTPELVVASAMVGRLRNTYSRDLIVEKVTEDTPGERKENAVYVINPTGSADSRVVADLSLEHR